ncbi:MAG: hypothetical protein IPN42_18485 [Methylococcaceae bacterium]|nr:hypothetical protein [Methylococcaceae bacterium]
MLQTIVSVAQQARVLVAQALCLSSPSTKKAYKQSAKQKKNCTNLIYVLAIKHKNGAEKIILCRLIRYFDPENINKSGGLAFGMKYALTLMKDVLIVYLYLLKALFLQKKLRLFFTATMSKRAA